jgi:hypothetical protein
MTNKQRAGMFAVWLVAELSVQAEVVFRTDFGSATQSAVGSNIVHNGAAANGYTVSDFSKGPGIVAFRLDPSFVSGGVTNFFIGDVAGTNPGTNLVSAVVSNAYIQFAVTAPLSTSFTNLSFAMRGFGATNSAWVTVRSSVDNYTADLVTVSGSLNGLYPTNVNLSAVSGFLNTNLVTFRFYLYDTYSGSSNRRIGVDDVSVETVAGRRISLVVVR